MSAFHGHPSARGLPASRHSVPCATVSSLDQVARDVDPQHVRALIAALEFPTGCVTRIRRQASREPAPDPGTRRCKRMPQ